MSLGWDVVPNLWADLDGEDPVRHRAAILYLLLDAGNKPNAEAWVAAATPAEIEWIRIRLRELLARLITARASAGTTVH